MRCPCKEKAIQRHTDTRGGEGHATTEAEMSESAPSQAVPRFTVTVGSWETVVEEIVFHSLQKEPILQTP